MQYIKSCLALLQEEGSHPDGLILWLQTKNTLSAAEPEEKGNKILKNLFIRTSNSKTKSLTQNSYMHSHQRGLG